MKHVAPSYFEALYSKHDDPWGFDDRWYERRKYALTLASLPKRRYERAFEPGCANGALTELLAERCAELVACELVPNVASRARERLAARPTVYVENGAIPTFWPEGSFDLVVASELLYYLTDEGLADFFLHVKRSLRPGGHLVTVHWRGETNYPRTGDDIQIAISRFAFENGWTSRSSYRESSFSLDVHERGAGL